MVSRKGAETDDRRLRCWSRPQPQLTGPRSWPILLKVSFVFLSSFHSS